MSDLDHVADELNTSELRHIHQEEQERQQHAHLFNDAYGDFHGLNLGIIKIGVQNGSAVLGVDVGIAHAGVSLGEHTGVGAGVGVPNFGAGGAAGFSIDERHGLRGGVHAGVEVGPIVGARAGVGAELGPETGVRAGGGAHLGTLEGGAHGKAFIDKNGAHARGGAGAEFLEFGR